MLLFLFFFPPCTAKYMSSCPCWCSLSHSIKHRQQANYITNVINITCPCNHLRCFITLTRREKRERIQRWSMDTLHTVFQEIHSEVAAVLKLSRSSLAKPDKSASMRVSAQKALPKLIVLFSSFCFSFAYWKLALQWWWWCWCWSNRGRGSNMKNVFAPKAKCRQDSLKILCADRWLWWLTDIVSHKGDLLETGSVVITFLLIALWSWWMKK